MTREDTCSTKTEKFVLPIQTLFQLIYELEISIQVLESRDEKTAQIAICLLLPIRNPLRAKIGRLSNGQPRHSSRIMRMTDTPDHHLIHRLAVCTGSMQMAPTSKGSYYPLKSRKFDIFFKNRY